MLNSSRTHLYRRGRHFPSLASPAGRAPGRSQPAQALALLGCLLCSAPALAELSDTIHPFAAINLAYDDNLLRVADDAADQGAKRSDTSRQVQGGLLFERPIGRQVLSGHVKMSKVSFDRYNQLDYNGTDALGELKWALANHLSGHLGTSFTETLAPYTDFHTDERNLRVQRRTYADAIWRFHPSWQLRSGVVREKYSFDLLAQRFYNRTEDTGDVGVDYLASSGSRFGVQLRHKKGSYPEHRSIGAVVIDDGFSQNEVNANIFWALSEQTQVQFLGGWVRREHAFFSSRDESGTNGRLIATWAPLDRLKLTGAAWREFAVVDGTLVNSSLNKGASLGLGWEASAKLRLDAEIKRVQRDFTAVSGFVPTSELNDETRSATLGLTYMPVSKVQLGVNAFHDARTGSPGITTSYRANGISFNASTQF